MKVNHFFAGGNGKSSYKQVIPLVLLVNPIVIIYRFTSEMFCMFEPQLNVS